MKKQDIINFWKKLDINENNILSILEKITGLNSSQLFLSQKIEDKYISIIEELFTRNVSWEPIEYIVNKAEFYWLDFFVDYRTLIPRNDTEIMVEQALEYIPEETILIDVWTWSSCIPISILKNLNNNDRKRILQTYVIDIEKKALEVSKININSQNLDQDIIQVHSSLLDNFINTKLDSKNLIITANLPYIKNNDFENMDDETVIFEPDSALYWWEKTWFELYEKLIEQTIAIKNKNKLEEVFLFIEIWFDQKEISKLFLNKLNLKFEIFKDNWWVERCIKIYI